MYNRDRKQRIINMSDTQRILINSTHGGFMLSDDAIQWLITWKGWSTTDYNVVVPWLSSLETAGPRGVGHRQRRGAFSDNMQAFSHKGMFNERTDADILDCFDALGSEQFSGDYSSIISVDIPADVEWMIKEYDGTEHIAEVHRTWCGNPSPVQT
jgi:hypothetical protein